MRPSIAAGAPTPPRRSLPSLCSNMTRLLTIVCLGLTLAGTAFAGQRGFIPKDNGGTINSDGSVPLSFYGHATTTQQTVNAAASTNSAATVTVYTYSLSATAAVTNRTLQ